MIEPQDQRITGGLSTARRRHGRTPDVAQPRRVRYLSLSRVVHLRQPGSSSRRAAAAALLLAMATTGGVCGCGAESDATGPAPHASVGGAGGSYDGGGLSGLGGAGGAGGQPVQLKGPPYPIVLAHGFFGFDTFAGVDFIDYFFHVKEFLALRGEVEVYTPAVDPFNSTEYRAAQLTDRIHEILQQTGYAKVNIIAHSQGGLDARVVAHEHPEWVASVVTVATPHHGTIIADIALKLVDDPLVGAVLDFFLQTVGVAVWDEVGDETSFGASLHSFTKEEIEHFNATYTDQPGVFYASFAGRTDFSDGGVQCSAAAPPFVLQFADTLDPCDPLFQVTESILDGDLLESIPNDGLVRVEDARWGKFYGCIPADHPDEIGQMLGDSPGIGNDWDYQQFYADVVALLRDLGL
jgi:triacylglycerol lipase